MHGVDGVTIGGFIGNIVGGSFFVALVYWVIYLRPPLGNRPDPNVMLKK